MSTDFSRLRAFITYLRDSGRVISDEDFANSIGKTKSVVSETASGKRKITANYVKTIVEAFPELNASWLLTGEGDMLIDNEVPIATLESEHNEAGAVQYFPDIPATASGIEDLPNPSWEDMQYTTLYIPQFGGCKAVKAWGDSMYPKLSSGDIVIFSEWNENYVQNGEMYLIITRNGERMFKYLSELPKQDEERIFECISANPDQRRYSPFRIKGSDIVRLYRVRGRIQEL